MEIILPVIIAIILILLCEIFIDDSSTRQLIYMAIIGACVLKYVIISETLFTIVFGITFVVLYLTRYLFKTY